MNMQHCLRLQKLVKNISRQNKGALLRTYLTASSECNDAWKTRFEEPLIKDIKPLETSYKLLENEATSKFIHAIDLDIFAHSVMPENMDAVYGNLRTLLVKFRLCNQNYLAFPSTSHAVLRLLIDDGNMEEIFELLNNPVKYGVFLDEHTAKLIMDVNLMKQRYNHAASCASHLMLQEEFSSPICNSFAILSCLKYTFTKDKIPLRNAVIEEPDDEEYDYRVEFRKIEDDHFDLTDEQHIIGKTLVYVSYYIEDGFIKHNAAILGWSLFEKWGKLETALRNAQSENISLATDICSFVEGRIETCTDENQVSILKDCLEAAKKSGREEAVNCVEYVEKHVEKVVKNCEPTEAENQNKIYTSWAQKRINIYKKIQKSIRDAFIKEKIRDQKREIGNKSDYVHFFDNENLWLERAEAQNKKIEAAKARLQKVKRKDSTDIDYVIPEMSEMPALLKSSMVKRKKVQRTGREYIRFRDMQDQLDEKSRRHCGFFLYGSWRTL